MINMEAEKIKIGSDGLVVLPYLMGERTPLWERMLGVLSLVYLSIILRAIL